MYLESKNSVWCYGPHRKNIWVQEHNIAVDPGVTLPTLTSKNPHGEFVLLICIILGFADLRVNVLQIDRY